MEQQCNKLLAIEELNRAAGQALYGITEHGKCVSQTEVVVCALRLLKVDDVDMALLRFSIDREAAHAADGNGDYFYAVSEKANSEGPFYRRAVTPLPEGHFDYVRPKLAEPTPVLPPAHNPLSITGYRHLTPEEIEQINRIKAVGETLQSLCAEAGEHISAQYDDAFQLNDISGVDRLQNADPNRWLCEGRQKLQEGLMCLIRAIAQPSSF